MSDVVCWVSCGREGQSGFLIPLMSDVVSWGSAELGSALTYLNGRVPSEAAPHTGTAMPWFGSPKCLIVRTDDINPHPDPVAVKVSSVHSCGTNRQSGQQSNASTTASQRFTATAWRSRYCHALLLVLSPDVGAIPAPSCPISETRRRPGPVGQHPPWGSSAPRLAAWQARDGTSTSPERPPRQGVRRPKNRVAGPPQEVGWASAHRMARGQAGAAIDGQIRLGLCC